MSYKDPFYVTLASNVESKLGLPAGLLSAIVTKGERSNADQVSEAGAKSVFQIIPSTRKAALDKWGIDAYVSPENAAEVGGLLLKDSLKRNNGDVAAAVGEYHGGTDRSNWGPRTRAYVGRVTTGLAPAPVDLPPATQADPAALAGPSTFDRVMASMKPQASALTTAFQAYQSGQMSPEDSAELESQVRAGRVMLPQGVTLKNSPASGGRAVPASLLAAYQTGAMSPQDAAEFKAAVEGGQLSLPDGQALTAPHVPGTNDQIPLGPGESHPAGPADPTLVDKALGVAQAGANTIAGAVGGGAGALYGGLEALGENVGSLVSGNTPQMSIEQQALKRAQQFTPELPKAMQTPLGQQYAGNVADFVQANAPSLIGVGPEIALLGKAMNPARVAVADAVRAAPAEVAQTARAVRQALPGAAEAAPTPGTMGSTGAAAMDIATQRRAAAADLPVPISLTKGQAERTFEQQRFERETAKAPEAGAPLRDRYAEQNQQMAQNIDAFIDQTGAEAPTLRATGVAVDDAVNAAATHDKAQIRVAYRKAEKAGEMQEPISTDAIVQTLNDSVSAEATAPVLKAAKAELVRLGGAAVDDAGQLTPGSLSLGDTEMLRKFVNKTTGIDPTNGKFAGDIKRAIDASTEGAGGELYKEARQLRTRFAQNYENHTVINDILKSKRGTTDRAVALEDIHRRTILDGSLDDVRQVRRVLHRSGPQGEQAWRELQGQTLNHIRDQAFGNSVTDVRGNPILSAAKLDRVIKSLDSDGKLDFVFGKRGAEKLRTLNDLAKDIYTAPPGSVNTSNTASVLLAAMDMAMSAGVGMPFPVTSAIRMLAERSKNSKLRARVNDALGPITKQEFQSRKAARMADPKPQVNRSFSDDYPQGVDVSETGGLTRDIEGRPLEASYIVGRQTRGGNDVPLVGGNINDAAGLLGARQSLSGSLGQDVGRYIKERTPGGDVQRSILVDNKLPAADIERVFSHEFGHMVDDLAGGMQTKGVATELATIYNDLNNPFPNMKGKMSPKDHGYKGSDVEKELFAEAIRAYLRDPNYVKTIAPKTSALIRSKVNSNVILKRVIQFNSVAAGAVVANKLLGQTEPRSEEVQ